MAAPVNDPVETELPDAGRTRELLNNRLAKRDRLRDEFGVDPYGQRVDGLMSIATARQRFDPQADAAIKNDPSSHDTRAEAAVAGRIVQHRVMGNLIFMVLRDGGGEDLQIAVSKKVVGVTVFKLARLSELSDIVAARGRLGTTKTGELTLWAEPEGEAVADTASGGLEQGFVFLTKSLALPPGKFHGLRDPEARYRKRYVDLYTNPEVMRTLATRSRLVQAIRAFLAERGFLEVETPMMQPIPGGAAARPFVTHHNALDLELFLRIAPELYLKRLLVGGFPRVFEINRNFRNEGIDRSHNPEFTMLELYEAYGDLYTVLDLTQALFAHLAELLNASEGVSGRGAVRRFADHELDFGAFRRVGYYAIFEEVNGFPGTDADRLTAAATALQLDTAKAGGDPDRLLNMVWEATVEPTLIQPTFVIDYPLSLCPLTKPKTRVDPHDPPGVALAERFELFIAGMELANAYTELNDPEAQAANFEAQVGDAEEDTFRNVDEDFLEALRVGMPPAGGLGIGIDRLVMLMTDQQSIRDVILFPLMRPQS